MSTSLVGASPRLPQRGVVVFIALVAALAMALSATALMRVVETTVKVAGNLGFMQSAVAASDDGVEHAVAALFERALVADATRDDMPQGYFASLQPGQNARGVPAVLQSVGAYPAAAPVLDAGNGNAVRYVIERMCIAPGPGTPDNCNVVAASDAPVDPPRVPLFRQTVRIDGPAGATALVQVFLADIPTGRRVAWRTLAD
jgi:hypothetical protein